MFLGFLYGVLACLIWGTVYIAPIILGGYDPLLIALGRYLVFGTLSCILAVPYWRELKHYTKSDWLRALSLGLIGNITYYYLLASSIQLAGAPVAGAFTAVIPIFVALIGNHRARKTGDAVPVVKLFAPLLMIFIGMACLNGTEFIYLVGQGYVSDTGFMFGVVLSIAALLIWTWYPICHGEWLLEHPKNTPQAWSTAQGMTLLPASLIAFAVYASGMDDVSGILGPTPELYIGVVLFLGIVTSWLGILLWSLMCQRLPTALAGQVIIFETIFAIIYTHILRQEWPTELMLIGIVFLLFGILLALRVFRNAKKAKKVSAA